MELFGILFSIPVAFVASTIYYFLLAEIVARFGRLSRAMFIISVSVLGAIALEWILLGTLGAVRLRQLVGISYYPAHLMLFVLGTPALANVIVLRERRTLLRSWFAVVPLCTALAFGLVLTQYGVAEALYGIDGGGPFSGDPLSVLRLQDFDRMEYASFADSAPFDSRANASC